MNYHKKIAVLIACLFWHSTIAIPLEDIGTVPLQTLSEDNQDIQSLAETDKLIFTSVLYRHGDRTPVDFCPNDPNSNRELWSKDWGQLTNLGAQQLYSMGQYLRKRYGSILSTTYKPTEIYVRSTDVDRTIASALSCLAGLYPPLLKEMWNKDIRWQPIPVHTVAESVDYLLGNSNCQRIEWFTSLGEYIYANGLHELLQPALEQYNANCGKPVTTFVEWFALYNTWKVEDINGYPVPDWTRPYYGDEAFENLYNFVFLHPTYTREKSRLSVGPLIKDMLDNMVAKANGQLERSMTMYSAHDNTVTNVLNGLGLYETNPHLSPPPGYGSLFMMDLYLDPSNDPVVQISYKNDTYSAPQVLNIPKCGTQCPLNMMYTLYEDILPVDILADCAALEAN